MKGGNDVKISEAQRWISQVLQKSEIKRSPLASLLGVYEELGELSVDILRKEGFKKAQKSLDIEYKLAEVFFELLKLAEDCNVDLEEAFVKAMKQWEKAEPLWK
jgi:NTP pyrophosphatase (non-canonical NTP hydrolase)